MSKSLYIKNYSNIRKNQLEKYKKNTKNFSLENKLMKEFWRKWRLELKFKNGLNINNSNNKFYQELMC